MEPDPKEIAEIIAWCEEIKKKRMSVYVIEKNPFKFEWTRNILNIEIDRPLSLAAKTSLVYDSISKKLYRFVNGAWMPLNSIPKVKAPK